MIAAPLALACGVPRPLGPPPRPTVPDGPGLRVALAWDAPVDLDLYVTDPAAETAYFANRTARSGVRLVRDARCSDVTGGGGLEQAVAEAPPTGRWRIGVDFIDACGTSHERVPFRIVVAHGDDRREIAGEVGRSAFEAVVIEVEVADGTLRDVPAR